jgi:hypothetical protein
MQPVGNAQLLRNVRAVEMTTIAVNLATFRRLP